MKVALDSNVLVYAEGINDAPRGDRARQIVAGLPSGETFLPAQALGELFHVLTRKAGFSPGDARSAVLGWRDAFAVVDADQDALLSAMDLAADHRFSIWDSVIIAVAARARCRILLSEDLAEGFTWQGVTVVNPFAQTPHPLLQAALAGAAPTSVS